MEQTSSSRVVAFKLPPLVRRLTPDDINERLEAVKGEDCLLSFYRLDQQSLIMFRFKSGCLDYWFAQAPMTRQQAIEIVQQESIDEHLPQSRNYFYEIERPNTPADTVTH